jgi:hypothetical protein
MTYTRRQTANSDSARQPSRSPFIVASELWTPTLFDLSSGNPFAYEARPISVTLGTKAFKERIDTRDKKRCVVCGEPGGPILEHAHSA